jgi:hypothetical protein
VLRTTKADRTYTGFDLSLLDDDLKPDRVVMAADLTRDGLAFPAFYGEDMLLPEGKTPAYLGQAVAILIFRDFVHFRFAKEKLQFNDANIRYGAITGPLHRDPWGRVPVCPGRREDALRRRCVFLPEGWADLPQPRKA